LRVNQSVHSPCFDTLKGTSWEIKLAMKQHEESKQSQINWYLCINHSDFWTYLIETHLEIYKKKSLIMWKFWITTADNINLFHFVMILPQFGLLLLMETNCFMFDLFDIKVIFIFVTDIVAFLKNNSNIISELCISIKPVTNYLSSTLIFFLYFVLRVYFLLFNVNWLDM
jgi:hypothetical protein